MSENASTNFATSFDTQIKLSYQEGSKLMSKVRVQNNVIGSTHKFHKIGKAVASDYTLGADPIPANVTQTNVTATLSDKRLSDYAYVADINKLTYDEKSAIIKTIGFGMGRSADQLIIDAMATSANTTQVSDDLGGSSTGMNVEKILRAKRLMDDNGIPMEDRYMAVTARALEEALQETQIGSSDYNVLKPLVDGSISKWGGFQFTIIESRSEGGLPLYTTSVRNCFAWHKDAVGLAVGKNIMTQVYYDAPKLAYLCDAFFSMGAVTIDTDGVFDVLSYES